MLFVPSCKALPKGKALMKHRKTTKREMSWKRTEPVDVSLPPGMYTVYSIQILPKYERNALIRMSKSVSTYYISMNCTQTLLAPVCIEMQVHKCVLVLYFPTNNTLFLTTCRYRPKNVARLGPIEKSEFIFLTVKMSWNYTESTRLRNLFNRQNWP